MPGFSLQKRLAAEIMGVGESRVAIVAKTKEELSEVESAITREDVKKLIEKGLIIIKPAKSNSRGRLRKRKLKKRTKGYGKRKGKASARSDPKEQWTKRIRKIRAYLKYLRDKGVLPKKLYRKLYAMAKGGAFPTFASLRLRVEEELKRLQGREGA